MVMYVAKQQGNDTQDDEQQDHGKLRREECERLIDVVYNTDESTGILVKRMQEVCGGVWGRALEFTG